MNPGDIYTKYIESGFRSVGSQVEVIEHKDGLVIFYYLPRNPDVLLGNDVGRFGEDMFYKTYKLPNGEIREVGQGLLNF